MTNLPQNRKEGEIRIEILNSNIFDGAWIIGGFLSDLDTGKIRNLRIQQVEKGENSITFILVVQYFDAEILNLINDFYNFVLNGNPVIDDLETLAFIISPFYRIAKYIVKRKSKKFSAKVNDIEIFYGKMDHKVRDKLLKDDEKQLRLGYNDEDKK
jgi:hypothetical protein